MLKSEVHLFILWEKARSEEKRILEDIANNFNVLKIYEILWHPENVSNNFTRFYGTNLPKNSFKEMECGTNKFLLVIIEDMSPCYAIRYTSKGYCHVNVNVFDAKCRYRGWTGGGHKIHATNNIIETNHDLTLLLGLNTIDFISSLKDRDCQHVINVESDLIGAKGWNSIEELFYVLNNTTNYVILRGRENLDSGYLSEAHRDIDILTSEYSNLKYIINGISTCSVERPHELISINGIDYYLDIWDQERHYFDCCWCRYMLENRKLIKCAYILDDDSYVYNLLYHCILHKGTIPIDYKTLFSKRFHSENKDDYVRMLVNFLENNNYIIEKPQDRTILLHVEHPIIKAFINKHGNCVSSSHSISIDAYTNELFEWRSAVYRTQTSYIKFGTRRLIANEVEFLKELQSLNHFQCLLNYEIESDSYMETAPVNGVDCLTYFSKKSHWRPSLIKSFLREVISILTILDQKNILHRDFISQNILIETIGSNCKVVLIDFGWAIKNYSIKNNFNPKGLGREFAPKDGYSDYYTFGKTLEFVFSDKIKMINDIAKVFTSITFDDYQKESIYEKKKMIYEIATNPIGFLDRCQLFLYRHPIFLFCYKKSRSLVHILSSYVIDSVVKFITFNKKELR